MHSYDPNTSFYMYFTYNSFVLTTSNIRYCKYDLTRLRCQLWVTLNYSLKLYFLPSSTQPDADWKPTRVPLAGFYTTDIQVVFNGYENCLYSRDGLYEDVNNINCCKRTGLVNMVTLIRHSIGYYQYGPQKWRLSCSYVTSCWYQRSQR
jgi:hypothetical protein